MTVSKWVTGYNRILFHFECQHPTAPVILEILDPSCLLRDTATYPPPHAVLLWWSATWHPLTWTRALSSLLSLTI